MVATSRVLRLGFFFLLGIFSVFSPAQARSITPGDASLLTKLQDAAGPDWSVTEIPDGYLATFRRPVVFLSKTESNSKLNLNQRLARTAPETLRIKILWMSATGSVWDSSSLQLIRLHAGGYFLCENGDDYCWTYWPERKQKTMPYLFCNQPPGTSLHLDDAAEALDQTVSRLAKACELTQLMIED